MSGQASASSPYTITIGNAGTYTNDSKVDMSAFINQKLESAPTGATIDFIFEPGNYAIAHTILLPSNTNVIGNGATISILQKSGVSFNGTGMFANADSYALNNQTIDHNSDGTTTIIALNPSSTDTITTNSSTAIIDSNITVSGLVFNETGNTLNTSVYTDTNTNSNVFGTWFINAQNIVVQNNIYIGGNDGNALVNVVNAVVSGNIGVGQLTAYDNWNGPVNVTTQDNSAWQYSANEDIIAGSVQINPTPSGDVNNPGTANNDGIIDNIFSGDTPNLLSATQIWNVPGMGSTVGSAYNMVYNLTQQGNIDSLLNTPDAQGYYQDYVLGSTTQDNLISQVVVPSNQNDNIAAVNSGVISNVNWGAAQTSQGKTIGNLIAGAYTTSQNTTFLTSQGSGSTVFDNAILEASLFGDQAFSGTSLSGNIENSGTTDSGSGIAVAFEISAVPNLNLSNSASIALAGTLAPTLIDQNGGDIDTVTLSVQFGSLVMSTLVSGVTLDQSSSGQSLVLTGDVSDINQALSDVVYMPDLGGTSDSIELTANNQAGASAVRYIPIIVSNGYSSGQNIVTLGAGFLNALPQLSTLFPGESLPIMPSLTGEVLIADGAQNILNMGGTVSLAFLNSGSSTVQGGSGDEFIAAGTGPALLNLTQSGDITVEGGAGALTVNADTSIASVSDLIQTGSSDAIVDGGAGALTVLGGLGNLTLNGGSGSTYLATLPADGGNLQANLGAGNSSVFALSGNSTISTATGTNNYIQLGIGNSLVRSAGTDDLVLGSGAVTIDGLAGGIASVISGGALITYIDDTAVDDTSTLLVGGPSGVSIAGASSPTNVKLIGNGDLIAASGALSVNGGSLNDTVIGGTGLLSYNQGSQSQSSLVLGGSGGAQVNFTGGADSFLGGNGASSVTATNANSVDISLGAGGGSTTISKVNNATIITTLRSSSTISIASSLPGVGLPSSSLIESYGKDAITLGDYAIINSYAGSSDTISASGFTTVNGYAGSSDTITASGELDLNVGLGNAIALTRAYVEMQAGIATISATNLSETYVTSQSATLYFINTSILHQTVIGGSGGRVIASAGPGGGVYVGGSAGGNSLIGGTGVVTLIGGGIGDYLQANSSLGTNTLSSGVGTETLVASSQSGSNDFIINPGADDNAVSQGSGTQTFLLCATTGDVATLTGSNAANAYNVFDVQTGAGHDGATYLIRNFSTLNCAINLSALSGNGAPDCGTPKITKDQSGFDGTIIQFSNNTSIFLQDYNSNDLYCTVSSGGILTIR